MSRDEAIRELHDKLSHILDVAQEPRYADHFVGRQVQREAEELRRLLDIIEPLR